MNRKRKSNKAQKISYYYLYKKDFQKALKNFQRAIWFKNSKAFFREENYHDIAYCYENIWNYEKAYEYIQRCLEISPWYLDGKKYLWNLLVLMWKKQEWEKILKECEKLEKDIQDMPLDLDVFYKKK